MAKVKTISAKDFKEFNKHGKIKLIDVSKIEKFNAGSIPNSVNVPYKIFKTSYQSFAKKDMPNYVTDYAGTRKAAKAAKILMKNGYDVTFIEGGSDAYAIHYNLVRLIRTEE